MTPDVVDAIHLLTLIIGLGDAAIVIVLLLLAFPPGGNRE